MIIKGVAWIGVLPTWPLSCSLRFIHLAKPFTRILGCLKKARAVRAAGATIFLKAHGQNNTICHF